MSRSRAIRSLLSRATAAAASGGEAAGTQHRLAALASSSSSQAASPSTSALHLLRRDLLSRRSASSSSALPSIGSHRREHQSSAAFGLQQQLRWRSSSSSSSNQNGAAEEAADASTSSSGDGQRVVPEGEGEANELPSSPEELRAALEESSALLAASEQTATELRDRLARAVADMENLRERTARQAESARAFAVQSLVKNLLDVADNLSRAREAAGDAPASSDAAERLSSLVQGVELTEKVLLSAFRSAGVESFGGEGDAFDPNEMEAMFEVPTSAAVGSGSERAPEPGHVAVVTKRGYKLNGRVVRPAQVGVFK